MKMADTLEKVLYSEEDIQDKVKELSEILTEEYKDKNPVLVCILKGGVTFMADLMKEMDIFLEIDFMDVSSYGHGLESTNEVKILKDMSITVEGRHVLFVEDIIDTGNTLHYLDTMFKARKAASVRAVTLLDKSARRKKDFEADWVGFEVPDEFVVGYGLDYKGRYRNLPYIGVLKPEIYE